MSIGLTLPFSRATGSLGYFEVTNDELSAVRENLKSLLVTNWGERLMNYNFGCNLIEFLFENEGSSETKARIIDRISTQVDRWLPFVSVEQIDVSFPDEDGSLLPNTIGIRIKFKLTSRPELSSILNFAVSAGSN